MLSFKRTDILACIRSYKRSYGEIKIIKTNGLFQEQIHTTFERKFLFQIKYLSPFYQRPHDKRSCLLDRLNKKRVIKFKTLYFEIKDKNFALGTNY